MSDPGRSAAGASGTNTGVARPRARDRVAGKALRGHQRLKAVKATLTAEVVAEHARTVRAEGDLIRLAAADLAIQLIAAYEQKLREAASPERVGDAPEAPPPPSGDGERKPEIVLEVSEQQIERAAQRLEEVVSRYFDGADPRADPWSSFAEDALAHAIVGIQEELEEELGEDVGSVLPADWLQGEDGARLLEERGASKLRRFTREYAQQLAREAADKELNLRGLSVQDLDQLLQLRQSSTGGAQKLPNVPEIGASGLVRITSDQVSYALVRAIHDATSGQGWAEGTEGYPTHTTSTSRGRGAVHVSLRAPSGRLGTPADVLPALWEQVRTLDDLTSDALLVCLAHWASRSDGPETPVWITAEAILDARGIQRKRYNNEPGNWRHGHRTEDRMDAGRALAQLENIWVRLVDVEVIPKGKGRQRSQAITGNSRALAMLDTVTQEDIDGRPIFLGARVMPGQWAQRFWDLGLRWRGLLAQKALEYDPYRERVEKRLGKYFAFFFRWNAGGRTDAMLLNVSTLLTESGLEADRRNPQRTRDRLERGLNKLRDDRVIADWAYRRDLGDLPPRGWLDGWMGMGVEITPPTELREQYGRLSRGA